MLEIPLPAPVLQAIDALEWASFEGFLVGGGLRDSLLGLRVDDYDLATDATPEEMKRVFAGYRIYETGIAHGTLQVIVDGLPLEITTYRSDGKYLDHRRPQQVRFSKSLREDVARRDFTVNAMAYHPVKGLIDYYGGLDDLRGKCLRCVGSPAERFDEDALRILRALRLAAKLGFEIEAETARALLIYSPLLESIASERILKELLGLLRGAAAGRVLQNYLPVLFSVIPELAGTDARVLSSALAQIGDAPHLRLCALLHQIPFDKLRGVLRRLRVDRRTGSKVLEVLAGFRETLPSSLPDARRFAGKYRETLEDILDLKEASKAEEVAPYRQMLEGIRLRRDPLTLEDLAIDGEDLLQAGVRGGPAVGELLEQLLEFVYEQPMGNTRARLLARARELSGE